MKYDLNFKLDCVGKYKEGRRDFVPSGISRSSFLNHACSWVKSFDELGIDGLKCIKKGRPVKDGRTI